MFTFTQVNNVSRSWLAGESFKTVDEFLKEAAKDDRYTYSDDGQYIGDDLCEVLSRIGEVHGGVAALKEGD